MIQVQMPLKFLFCKILKKHEDKRKLQYYRISKVLVDRLNNLCGQMTLIHLGMFISFCSMHELNAVKQFRNGRRFESRSCW